MSPTIPRLCVMSKMLMPSRFFRSQQQIENLRLDRHIQRRGRLVRHQQLRFGLPAPWQSSRAAASRRTSGADNRGCAIPARECPPASAGGSLPSSFAFSGPVQLERFLDLVAHAENRIQRRARVLKHITHHAAANAAQFALGHLQNVAAVHQNFAARVTAPAARAPAAQWTAPSRSCRNRFRPPDRPFRPR